MSIGGMAGRQPSTPPAKPSDPRVSILVYHRLGPSVRDAMTVRTSTFRSQLQYLREHHHPIVPLRTVIGYLPGAAPPPPPRSVVITVDDGHESVYREMLPVAQEHRMPVTLFIYPSAISNASYAMTWDQLRTLRDTGLFDIQSHTYWHPNFAIEKKRLAPAAYEAFVTKQLCSSKSILHDRLGVDADVVAWPFGNYDEGLYGIARDCGYVGGVTIDGRLAAPGDEMMAIPRFLVTDTAVGARFAAMLATGRSR
jgi:peptidoglycan/xylan/chitin deacetylase (PgdA/CDA1 family)